MFVDIWFRFFASLFKLKGKFCIELKKTDVSLTLLEGSVMFSGIIASRGIAIGKAFVLKDINIQISEGILDAAEVESEIARFKDAQAKTVAQLEEIRDRAAAKLGEEEAEVFEGHILIATDEELEDEVIDSIRNRRHASAAMDKAIKANIGMLAQLDDPYLRERMTDIRDVGQRMLCNLRGIDMTSLADVEEGTIIVANDLTPSETSQIDLSRVWGFITNLGGKTSHSAIMARSLELPAIVGSVVATEEVITGDRIIMDAVNNKVLVNPDQKALEEYQTLQEALAAEKAELAKLKTKSCETLDGKRFEMCANIGTSKDTVGALNNGAEGIGLYRTEFLFMDRDKMPTEQEQFEAYKEVAEAMKDRPVVIRTIDIGGDKDLAYLDMPKEMNPFLGWRAIRMCFDRPEILNIQLRAILRASHYGKLKIMFPMVISVEECRRLKIMVNEAKSTLKEQGVPFDDDLEVGIMVETPAAVMVADLLIEEMDFFSIGTNDLTQYILAVDRGNEHIASLYDYLSPSVLRAVKQVIDCSHAAGKWTGMCGEMAGDERAALVLAGFGLDEFSMSAISIPKVKKVLRSKRSDALVDLAEKVLAAGTTQDVNSLINDELGK
ncbi:Phosphoenolpyruvate-protein phosphotransferase [invertebrate metagenome]|uniref:Phosphoenolpyruvate-protein phosphotransferase n=1 Tax=invertebrate metagenome TaxID=1711999 RepID=A0A2H9T564_9ZZZZ